MDAFRGQVAESRRGACSTTGHGEREKIKKNKKQISKPNRGMITLLSAACDISQD